MRQTLALIGSAVLASCNAAESCPPEVTARFEQLNHGHSSTCLRLPTRPPQLQSDGVPGSFDSLDAARQYGLNQGFEDGFYILSDPDGGFAVITPL
jgi:hypothetical protein